MKRLRKLLGYLSSFSITIGFERAGLIDISIGRSNIVGETLYDLHLFCWPKQWQFGKQHDYDGCYSFGCGPLFLFCWCY